MDINSESRDRPERFTENHARWESLSAAIVRYAIDDYKHYGSRKRVAIERFIRSAYFQTISSIDPEWLIKNLREKYWPSMIGIEQ